MNTATLQTILKAITLPTGWRVRHMPKGDGWLVQIVFDAPDSDDPTVIRPQFCRKWYVSSHATASEVVRTVYKAGLAALEHEFDEAFKFQGVSIYHPHRDVYDMLGAFNKDMRHELEP